MNTDALIESWLDGSLDDAGCAELARQVQADPVLAARLADEARTHLALRQAFGRRPDLVDGVMAGLRGTESRSRLRNAVMRDLARRRRPARGAAWRWPALAAAAAVAVLAGVLVAAQWRRPQTVPAQHVAMPQAVPADQGLGVVDAAAEGTVIRRREGAVAGVPGAALLIGDVVAAPAGGRAALRIGGARIDLAGGGELALGGPGALDLRRGALRAEVAPRATGAALVFATPHATATVIGTALALEVGAAGTRLAVEHGRVAFAGLGRSATLVVEAGQAAIARPGADPALDRAVAVPLFADGLAAWTRERGTWAWRDGVVLGGAPGERSRLESRRSFDRFEMSCRVLVKDCHSAEIQADDYGWFITIAGDGAWHEVGIRRAGHSMSAVVDGLPAEIRSEVPGGLERAGGRISFYVRPGGTMTIADARIVTDP